ncbi:hypothetical protein K474DRAFT_883018 [Panus rudis PR-1116 ss-1]|nr:hypothetical protein K474DRAFT_883018 [Panus rudis PR-1116 ss-1]
MKCRQRKQLRWLLSLCLNLCSLVLGQYAANMSDPTRAWQTKVLLCKQVRNGFRYKTRFAKDLVDASRALGQMWHAIQGLSQENCMFAIQALFCRGPWPSRQFVLDVVKANPRIIDLLLRITELKREPWYPEIISNAVAAELLALLFQFPLDIVPELEHPFPHPQREVSLFSNFLF